MLEINFREVKSVAVLDLSGTIDINSANFIEMLAWCLQNGYKDILCNFENVNMVDYAGLSVLAIGYKEVVNNKGRIKLVNVPSHIRKLFCTVYLEGLFDVYQDEETALNSFKEDRIISQIQKQRLRRRFKRLPLDIDIEFKSASEEKYSRGKVLNISAVGLLVFAEKTYPLGQILRIRLSLAPAPGVIEVEARVVWLVQKDLQPQIYPGMGLEFYDIDSETQKKVIAFVDRNLPLTCSSEDL